MNKDERPKEKAPDGFQWVMTENDIVCGARGCRGYNLNPWKLEALLSNEQLRK